MNASYTSLANFIATFDKGAIRDPFLIAEAGVNHEGSIDLAKRLIEEAKIGGAHAIKFQTYKAGKIASKDSPYYWDIEKEPTQSQFELFQKYDQFDVGEYAILKSHCDKVGIEFLSTPFDVDSAAFLNEMMSCFKISSSDITNKPFIEHLCGYNKPIILSTGASSLEEIKQAVEWIRPFQVSLSLLHCVLNYPTDDENANLARIIGLKNEFPELIIGYSDHTYPKTMDVLVTSTLLGAVILEKHFTHDKTLPGNDHYHAMDKEDMQLFWKKWKDVKTTLGSAKINYLPSEEPARQNARRSLVLNADLPSGSIIERKHLTWKRPAHGISPMFIEEVIGKKTNQNLAEDTVLKWEFID